MVIGVPSERHDHEFRVSLVPAGVKTLVERGHVVNVERSAGMGSGITDEEYEAAGAKLHDNAKTIYEMSDVIVKVKEPLGEERAWLREEQILFTFLHLAPNDGLTESLLEQKTTSIAYETIMTPNGDLPLLTPMSEIAGRMAIQIGAHFLEKPNSGAGLLLGGVPGVLPAKVLILGGGVVGTNAAKMAVGLGADVTILERDHRQMQYLDDLFGSRVKTLQSNPYNIAHLAVEADLVVGAVLITGAEAPKLITRKMVERMKEGAVIIDVSIDQGGCIETARVTSHSDPVVVIEDVIHYGVPNMPGAVPRTSTFALTNVTFPYLFHIAQKGLQQAIKDNLALSLGVNTHQGKITCQAVAASQGRPYHKLTSLV